MQGVGSGTGGHGVRARGERQQGLDCGKSSEGDEEIADETDRRKSVEGMETEVERALPGEQWRGGSGFGNGDVMSYPGEAESDCGTVEGMSLGRGCLYRIADSAAGPRG